MPDEKQEEQAGLLWQTTRLDYTPVLWATSLLAASNPLLKPEPNVLEMKQLKPTAQYESVPTTLIAYRVQVLLLMPP
jgi:hypothetical protein